MPSKSKLITVGLVLVTLAVINNFAPEGAKKIINGK